MMAWMGDDMDYLLLVALVQGMTEFLPISSSGHLALLGQFYHAHAHPLWLDIAAHSGTLLAGMIFFRHDLRAMAQSLYQPDAKMGQGREMLLLLVIASLPAIIIGGLLFAAGLAPLLANPAAIGFTTGFFALLLAAAAFYGAKAKPASLTRSGALLVGMAQAFAFLPGASRTGVALTGALALGLPHAAALRFALLLGLPAIAGASLLAAASLASIGTYADIAAALLVALLAFLAGWAALALFVRFLPQAGLWFFIAYRLGLGAVLLAL